MRTVAVWTFIALLILIAEPGRSQPAFRNGNDHSGVYRDANVGNTVALRWRFETGGAVRSSPAVIDGKVLVGSSDGNLYCLRLSSGDLVWKTRMDGPVQSSPVVAGGVVYAASRQNTLFAVRLSDGKVVWKQGLGEPRPYPWAFDYYVGSAAVDGGMAYIGSADGHLLALDASTGRVRWRFRAGSLIRSTPALDMRRLYVGDCGGTVYALDRRTGSVAWTFKTIGDTLVNENFGFDRKAVIASPTISDGRLYVGGRDGFLYALDVATGTEVWKYDYNVSWIISTVAITEGFVVTGTSDGQFVHALGADRGDERWRFRTAGPVWASPSVSGNNVVVIPSNDGMTYALDLKTGGELWRYRLGTRSFSSPALSGSDVVVGCDDGAVYALTTSERAQRPLGAIKRAVFWMKDPPVQPFRNGSDVAIREYFISEGYEFYDQTDVASFLRDRVQSDTASVLVFASNVFLPELTRDTLGTNLLRLYLEHGGKVVVLSLNPAVYAIDFVTKKFSGYEFSRSDSITGIRYAYNDLRSFKGFYHSTVTEAGKAWGLRKNFVGVCGMPVGEVSVPLALDENGYATAWVKTFSSRRGAGFVQLLLTPDRLNELPDIQRVAEYGLR